MKKIFKIHKEKDRYDAFYGNNFEAIKGDNSNLAIGYEYEMTDDTQLSLLWLTLHDYNGLVPMMLEKFNRLDVNGEFITPKLIDPETIRLSNISNKNKFVDITKASLLALWKKYQILRINNTVEIILVRDGKNFYVIGPEDQEYQKIINSEKVEFEE